jgi:hypothetical protein
VGGCSTTTSRSSSSSFCTTDLAAQLVACILLKLPPLSFCVTSCLGIVSSDFDPSSQLGSEKAPLKCDSGRLAECGRGRTELGATGVCLSVNTHTHMHMYTCKPIGWSVSPVSPCRMWPPSQHCLCMVLSHLLTCCIAEMSRRFGCSAFGAALWSAPC